MDKRIIVAGLALILCILLALSSTTMAMESANYAIDWDVMASGGGPMVSTSFAVNSTTGQAVTGFATSTGYRLGFGYWYIESYRVFLPLVIRT